ncbi:MAG: hypothetical protein HFI23_16360 [Lachnospiraceae bacterium]|nr:hypothetical protein [Lachnospiraceae bacterium]MCI9624880.1 hypothetical protein [Lachnospiraceae bacterium]
MNKRQRRTGACLILGGVMLCVLIRTRRLCQPYKEQEIAFSLEESFYSEDQELQLSTLLDSDIYCTKSLARRLAPVIIILATL